MWPTGHKRIASQMEAVAFAAEGQYCRAGGDNVFVGDANFGQAVEIVEFTFRQAHTVVPARARAFSSCDVDEAGSFLAGSVGGAADGGDVQLSLLFVECQAEKRVGIQDVAPEIIVDVVAEAASHKRTDVEPSPDAKPRNGVVAAEIGEFAVQSYRSCEISLLVTAILASA